MATTTPERTRVPVATSGDVGAGQRGQRPLFGRRRFVETKSAFRTTEFLTLILAAAGILIAAAQADNFEAPRAWLLVAIVASAYMISRGIAKAGKGHMEDE